jgi:hypothetical protein
MHLIRLSNSFVLISMCINQKKLRGWKHEQPTKSWAYYLDRHYTESTGGAHCHSIPCHYRLQGSSQGLRAPSACSVPCGAHWLPPPNANYPIYRTRERILPWCSHTRYCTTVAVIQDQRPVPTTYLLPKPQPSAKPAYKLFKSVELHASAFMALGGFNRCTNEWRTLFPFSLPANLLHIFKEPSIEAENTRPEDYFTRALTLCAWLDITSTSRQSSSTLRPSPFHSLIS